jgi:APA family basic amino acid/polyamine antiporter
MVFAMARRGDMPRFLAAVDHRHRVPGRAVLVIGGSAAIVAATGSLRGVASAAAFAILVYYAIANLAALRMPAAAKLYPDVIPWVGLVACSVLAFSLDFRVVSIGVGCLAVGVVGRAVLRRFVGSKPLETP